ncbi:MBL fold metallo-hydrolase [Streptomyces sp. NPDC006285]|uniref:MBL fold metallo-hydrolase n=1 Tax=Streptomyces sp. NPDC006285 TaxID=3364742 RepID=UPI003686DE75
MTELTTEAGARPALGRRAMLAGAAGTTLAAVATPAYASGASADTTRQTSARGAASKGRKHAMTWATLGTQAGPVSGGARRAQPANLLYGADQAVLVDVGDGAVDQLEKAGVDLRTVGAVVISHLHIDHTGGLWGLIGRRYQAQIPGEIVIYGPPGTQATVDGIVAAQDPLRGIVQIPPAQASHVRAVEITDGSVVTIGQVQVTAAQNSHYALEGDTHSQSLSYRFETPDRSIVFTGDTGPSANVERLAAGADLLVSEITDPDDPSVVALLAQFPEEVRERVRLHFTEEHLTAENVGLLAEKAAVKALTLTHVGVSDSRIGKARSGIGRNYDGPTRFSRDLDTF